MLLTLSLCLFPGHPDGDGAADPLRVDCRKPSDKILRKILLFIPTFFHADFRISD